MKIPKIPTALWYRARNLPALLRGMTPRLTLGSAMHMRADLSAILTKADGTVIDLGVVSRRVVTTAGVTALATCFTNTIEPETFNFHGTGTGAVAEAIGDTALGAEVGTRVSGTQSNPSAGVYRTVATSSYTGAAAITEHGIFSASSAGTLLDRSVFAAINVVNGDSIQWTYNLTLTAGG